MTMRALLLALLTAGCGLQAASIVSGVVVLREEGKFAALPKAAVIALTPGGKDVLARSRTDREGRFRLDYPLARRIALRVEKVGYLPVSAADQEPGRTLDCGREHACEGLFFEMTRAGVVAGRVTDELGEPFEKVNVSLADTATDGHNFRARTDDRGEFRIFGVPDGSYQLHTVSSYHRLDDSLYEGRPLEIEIKAGEAIEGLRVVMVRSGAGGFVVAGYVRGVEVSAERRRLIQVRPLGPQNPRSQRFGTRSVGLGKEGSFRFEKIPEGRYLFSLQRTRAPATPAEQAPAVPHFQIERLMLGKIEVRGNIEGLSLSPMPATGIRATFRFVSGAAGQPVMLSLVGEDGVNAPLRQRNRDERAVSNLQMLPGKYKLRGHREDYYIEAVLEDEKPWPANEVVLGPGDVRDVAIVLSREFAQVSGRVKAGESARRAAAANYRVALRGADERDGVISVQADQDGRFIFENVPPGDYEIGAWAGASVRAVKSDAVWDQAGTAVRAFPAEAGSAIEISLTAAL